MFLDPRRLRKIPIRTRIALGTTLIDRVHELYSTYFLEEFHQLKVTQALWAYALDESTSEAELKQLYTRLDGCICKAEEEGYDFYEVWMPGFLLEEIDNPNGKGLCGAIGAAGISFKSQALYMLGLNPADPRLAKHTSQIDALGDSVVIDVDIKATKLAEQIPESSLSRESFSSIVLPDIPDCVPEAIQMIAARHEAQWMLPPKHERMSER